MGFSLRNMHRLPATGLVGTWYFVDINSIDSDYASIPYNWTCWAITHTNWRWLRFYSDNLSKYLLGGGSAPFIYICAPFPIFQLRYEPWSAFNTAPYKYGVAIIKDSPWSRRHCRLTICIGLVELTNSVGIRWQDPKIILKLRRGALSTLEPISLDIRSIHLISPEWWWWPWFSSRE